MPHIQPDFNLAVLVTGQGGHGRNYESPPVPIWVPQDVVAYLVKFCLGNKEILLCISVAEEEDGTFRS